MFAWVGSKFDILLNAYTLDVVTSLMLGIAPIALSAMTLWIGFYGWALMRNEVSEAVPTFMWKVFKISLVLVIALQSGVYISNVSESANALAMGVASTFLPAQADPLTLTSPYALLDAFNDRASQLVLDLLAEAGITRLDLVFAAVLTAFGNVIFICVALFVITLAKVLLTFVIAIGPLFVLCLAWKPTQRFFDSWLSMVLNTVVLTWFAFFALGLSIFMGDAIVQSIQDQGGFLGPTLNVVGESLKYCIVMILMAVICFQAPSLASALTGGAAVQQGIQMIQNAMMVSGLRHRSSFGSSGSGGTVRGGAGIPYTAGHAAGRAAGAAADVGSRAASGVAAGASAAARAGSKGVRLAAYQLAALRSRDL